MIEVYAHFMQIKERKMLDILIVEDNKEIGSLLCEFLRKENYTVSVVENGEKALDLFERYGARVIVLDIMLPGMDGFAVCSKIRETSNAHILIASAKVEKNDKLKGLNLGADDYIEKPYDVDILIAKIKGIFKRKYGQEEIVEGNLRLNTVHQTLYVDGQKKEVTEKEFELLKLLIENKNVTMKKDYLFNNVWGSDSDSEIQTLTVHIKWLREKIEEEPKKPKRIVTEWGVGYRFE
jgi:DNA-binding response OmpR family regulator